MAHFKYLYDVDSLFLVSAFLRPCHFVDIALIFGTASLKEVVSLTSSLFHKDTCLCLFYSSLFIIQLTQNIIV